MIQVFNSVIPRNWFCFISPFMVERYDEEFSRYLLGTKDIVYRALPGFNIDKKNCRSIYYSQESTVGSPTK